MLFLVCPLLLCSLNYSVQAKASFFHSYNFDLPWQVRPNFLNLTLSEAPVPVKTENDSYVYVSVPFYREPQEIKIYHEDRQREPCTIPVVSNLPQRQAVTAQYLGNGRVFVHLNLMFEYYWVAVATVYDAELNIVDLNDCSYRRLEFGRDRNFIQLIDFRNNSFSVLSDDLYKFNSSQYLYTYGSNGDLECVMDFSHQLRFIEKIGEGYYGASFLDGRILIRELDSKFEEKKKIEIKSPLTERFSYSADHGKFTLCLEYWCLVANKNLNVSVSPYDKKMIVRNLRDDGFFIFYHFNKAVYLQHVTEDGDVEKPVKIGDFSSVSIHDIYAFEMNNRAYCFVVFTYDYGDDSLLNYNRKCIVPLEVSL